MLVNSEVQPTPKKTKEKGGNSITLPPNLTPHYGEFLELVGGRLV